MKTFQKFPSLLGLLLVFSNTFSFAQENAISEKSVTYTLSDSKLQWGPCPEFMPEGCGISVLHGNPSEPNSDILLKIPANSVIPNHTHTSAERMVLMAGEMEVTYDGEEPKKLIAGSYAYGPARKPHSAKCGDTPCILFIAFEEPLDAIPTLTKN